MRAFRLLTLRLTSLLALVFVLQVAFGYNLRDVRPYWEILDPPPSTEAIQALAFGDQQFIYRVLVAQLQTGGDSGGRVIPIKDYDINTVVQWLDTLDRLDAVADHHIALAMRIFSLSQRISDLEPLILYAQRHIALNPEKKIQWLPPALMLAQTRLKDEALVLSLARQLSQYDFPAMNASAYALPALLFAKYGHHAEALLAMRRAYRLTLKRAPEHDIQFMRDFIEEYEVRLQEK